MIDHLKFTPVAMTMCIGIISAPWCVKPLYGFVSDKYSVFDWGRRRPYIAMSGFLTSFMYVYMHVFIQSQTWFVFAMTFISCQLCISDVCADSITVELVKQETMKGDTQTKCWTARATGTLLGAILSGVSYNTYGPLGTFRICSFCPLLMSLFVWNLPKHEVSGVQKNVFKKLMINLKQQKALALVFILIQIAPDYGDLYTYFLTKKLNFSATDFSWLAISSSLTFLLATQMYNRCLLKTDPGSIILVGIVGGTLFRLTQLFVVSGILPYFWLVLLDGVAESFFDQLVLMPLIVKAAGACNEGVEGSLYALFMSLCNLSNVMGDWIGGGIGLLFGVTEEKFDNFIFVMCIGILFNFFIPCFIIQKMSSFSEKELPYDRDVLDRTLEPDDPEDHMLETSGNQDIQVKSVNKQVTWGTRNPWQAIRQVDSANKLATSVNMSDHIQVIEETVI